MDLGQLLKQRDERNQNQFGINTLKIRESRHISLNKLYHLPTASFRNSNIYQKKEKTKPKLAFKFFRKKKKKVRKIYAYCAKANSSHQCPLSTVAISRHVSVFC